MSLLPVCATGRTSHGDPHARPLHWIECKKKKLGLEPVIQLVERLKSSLKTHQQLVNAVWSLTGLTANAELTLIQAPGALCQCCLRETTAREMRVTHLLSTLSVTGEPTAKEACHFLRAVKDLFFAANQLLLLLVAQTVPVWDRLHLRWFRS